MIRSLRRLVRPTPLRCQVSLEERMACGFGACLGCAVKTTDSQGVTTIEGCAARVRFLTSVNCLKSDTTVKKGSLL